MQVILSGGGGGVRGECYVPLLLFGGFGGG
jgi:hypothetical protein